MVTPKRPDATCLIFDRRSSPKRRGSSPPSPVLDLPPRRFIARASVSCASVEIDPSDIAPVEKRRTMFSGGSTSSSGTAGWAPKRSLSSPRSADLRAASSLTSSENCLYFSYAGPSRNPFPPTPPSAGAAPEFMRTACCSSPIVSGFHMWRSPSRRQA